MTEPNGPVEHAFFVEFLDTIRRRLEATLPVDAVYICSHGAGLTTEEDDPDASRQLARQAEAGRAESVAALAASEQRYRSLVKATSSVVWATEPDGRVMKDVPEWRAFTGQSFEEIKDWGWLDAVHPDDRAATSVAWRQAILRRELFEVENRLRLHDGQYRVVISRAVPVVRAASGLAVENPTKMSPELFSPRPPITPMPSGTRRTSRLS